MLPWHTPFNTVPSSHASWKVLELFCKISRTRKVMKNDFLSWKVLDTYFLWFVLTVIKTIFFATCDSDEHCSMDATVTLLLCRVSNCCLSLYLHVAGDYERVLENTFRVLESPGKILTFILGKAVGTPVQLLLLFNYYCVVMFSDTSCFCSWDRM